MNPLSFVLLGLAIILLSLYLYQRTKYSAMQKRFIDMLREKDEEIDKLEKRAK